MWTACGRMIRQKENNDRMATWAKQSMINLCKAVLSDTLYHIIHLLPNMRSASWWESGGCQTDKPHLWSMLKSETYLLRTGLKGLPFFSFSLCVSLCFTAAKLQNKGNSPTDMQSHTASDMFGSDANKKGNVFSCISTGLFTCLRYSCHFKAVKPGCEWDIKSKSHMYKKLQQGLIKTLQKSWRQACMFYAFPAFLKKLFVHTALGESW